MAYVKQIVLTEDGDVEGVQLSLTGKEALYLAILIGKQSGVKDDEVWSGAASTSAEVYGALVGELFNRYYEDGVADAKEALL